MKRLTSLCTLTLATVSLLLVGVPPAVVTATAAPVTNGRILFTHCEDYSGCQIYTANPDGSFLERVTRGADSFMGDWAPDGKRIAFVSVATGDATIWIVNVDGSHLRQLTPDEPNSSDFWPRFTPDGKWILFTNCLGDDCDGGISAIRPDGTGLHHVTPNSGDSYNVADASPDGGRLAYMRWHVGGVKSSIYVSKADGSAEQRITPPRLEGWYPDWSPTGRRIVFGSYVFWDRPAPSLFTVRPDGSGMRHLTEPPYPHADYRAAYSPDGERVIFESDRRYQDFCCSDLFIVSLGGGGLRRIRLPFDAYEPRWGVAPILRSGRSIASAPSTLGERFGGPPCGAVAQLRDVIGCPGSTLIARDPELRR